MVNIFASCLVFFILAKSGFAQKEIVLGTTLHSPLSNAQRTGAIDKIIIKAFSMLGIAVEIDHLPAERSLKNANSGIADGDMFRIGGLSELYPNLIQVPENLFFSEFVAFTKNNDVRISVWDDLKPYSVGIINGHKILEERLAGVSHLTKVESRELLFKMLDNDRIEFAVINKFNGLGTIKDLGLNGITYLDTVLAKRDMFLYLHKKHQDLVSEVAGVLKQMKSDGTYNLILHETLSSFLLDK